MKQNEKYDEKKVAERHRDHSLFIAFAPLDNPSIAHRGDRRERRLRRARRGADRAHRARLLPARQGAGGDAGTPSMTSKTTARATDGACRSIPAQRIAARVGEGIDSTLLVIILALSMLGFAALFSASNDVPGRVVDQLVNLGVALVAMWLVAQIPPQTLMRFAVPAYVVGLALPGRGGAVRRRGERRASLAARRRHALPALGDDEARAAADARRGTSTGTSRRCGCATSLVAAVLLARFRSA